MTTRITGRAYIRKTLKEPGLSWLLRIGSLVLTGYCLPQASWRKYHERRFFLRLHRIDRVGVRFAVRLGSFYFLQDVIWL